MAKQKANPLLTAIPRPDTSNMLPRRPRNEIQTRFQQRWTTVRLTGPQKSALQQMQELETRAPCPQNEPPELEAFSPAILSRQTAQEQKT